MMHIYTIHEHPGLAPGDRDPEAVFIREGFCVPAVIFSIFWLLWYRLWREAVLFGVLMTVAVLVALSVNAPDMTNHVIRGVFSVALGVFAYDLRRAALARKGYREAGVVSGGNTEEASMEYLLRPAPAVAAQAAGAADNPVREEDMNNKPDLVAIIDYGSGNLRSAEKAFERMAAEGGSNARILVTSNPADVLAADRVVLPGVGAFGDCMAGLQAIDGMVEALEQAVIQDGKPFLGICVGMQLMASTGLEHGTHKGFGWVPGTVAMIEPADDNLKIPHMGWNDLQISANAADHPVFAGLDHGEHAYFVHSFSVRPEDDAHVLATVDYAGDIVAAIGRDNMVGTQFHPEKSQKVGLQLIANFLRWQPQAGGAA
jgi:glutamine amidotransferase